MVGLGLMVFRWFVAFWVSLWVSLWVPLCVILMFGFGFCGLMISCLPEGFAFLWGWYNTVSGFWGLGVVLELVG